jgi:hypothetical protein
MKYEVRTTYAGATRMTGSGLQAGALFPNY